MRKVFDDMNGEFSARLRAHKITTRTSRTREGELTLTSRVAVVEARFSLNVLDRLHEPSFIALKRPTSEGETYIIYEVVGVRPMHFQMLGMDVAVPKVIRKEFLETIDRGWKASEETWIDVIAVPTNYRMDIDEDGLRFERSNLTPLVGSEARILSRETVKEFLCVEGGVEVGALIGFNLPLTVNIMELVRYHTGLFGFTGCGKSNLSSYLLRKSLEVIPDLSVVIFDVAGEYLIHLLDLAPRIFSTEDFGQDVQRIIDSQAVPETLEEKLDRNLIIDAIKRLVDSGKVQKITLSQPREQIAFNMGLIMQLFSGIARKREKESIQAAIAIAKLNRFTAENGYDDTTPLEEIAKDHRAKAQLEEILNEFTDSIHSMSSTVKDVQSILNVLNEGLPAEETWGDEGNVIKNAEWLASKVVIGGFSGLNIVYAPEPEVARQIVSRFIRSLLWLKKTHGVRRTVLTVLDEAQEFIPDRTRRDDFTEESNKTVEALLRQGRKYRANCWVCSQRVAHLNVNALQQLHSYFVSVLPRFYDRMVIADAFSLSYDLLDKTTDLETGEWLFVSYKATKQRNVPTFIKTPNNEEILISNLTRERRP
ncbi:MAG: ATPase [Candidatus Bathyarchaeota archaeon B26-2]|nr:MAG: ATPase [Candidatus Bathyarchaeota archaeon B26-2]